MTRTQIPQELPRLDPEAGNPSGPVSRKASGARMKVLSVTSEVFPLIKTGGLADVTGSLPKALERLGVETMSLVPGYPGVMQKIAGAPPLLVFDDLLGERASLVYIHLEGLNFLILDAPGLYDRDGGPYVDAACIDHPDNWKRFAALSADDEGPVFSAVSRLAWQKGMDMLAETADEIIGNGGKLIVCGQGDHAIEQQLVDIAHRYPGRMAVHVGYDEPLAHLIHGGSDAIVQPSRFEPCGLTQLYALRYGCVPVVSRTGGLSETIIDANDAATSARVATGFQFHPVTVDGLRLALRRALQAYTRPRDWARLQTQGMKTKFSWDRSAQQYAAIYASLAQKSGRASPPDICRVVP